MGENLPGTWCAKQKGNRNVAFQSHPQATVRCGDKMMMTQTSHTVARGLDQSRGADEDSVQQTLGVGAAAGTSEMGQWGP